MMSLMQPKPNNRLASKQPGPRVDPHSDRPEVNAAAILTTSQKLVFFLDSPDEMLPVNSADPLS
jgi:hypothetical protein